MRTVLPMVLLLGGAGAASAQPAPAPRAGHGFAAEAHAGRAGFLDDSTDDHAVGGGAVRWQSTPRLSVGPEVTYMRGGGTDRDVFVMGVLTVDLRDPAGGGRVAPYIVVAGGLMAHASGYGEATWSSEGAIVGGAGVRIGVTSRFYLAPEFRMGWEPHARLTASAGWRF